jgi:hypothetical protein
MYRFLSILTDKAFWFLGQGQCCSWKESSESSSLPVGCVNGVVSAIPGVLRVTDAKHKALLEQRNVNEARPILFFFFKRGKVLQNIDLV